MTLKVTSNSVNSVQGVPISVTGIAQVEGEKNVELQGEMDAGWTYTEHTCTCTDSINEEKNSPQENNKSNRNCLYLSPLPSPHSTRIEHAVTHLTRKKRQPLPSIDPSFVLGANVASC